MSETSSNTKPWLLIWSGDGAGYALVGPFSMQDAAAAWATDPRNNPDDEPCWQVVDLTEPAPGFVGPPGPEAQAALHTLWPAQPEVPVRFTDVPYNLETIVREQTDHLVHLSDADMPDTERADCFAYTLRDFANQVLSVTPTT